MIKGHAVIELRDEKTGNVKKVEHDNMITNGLLNAITPQLGRFTFFNGYSNTYYASTDDARRMYNKSIMNHLLGGIFMFSKSFPADANLTEPPADNTIVGRASYELTYNNLYSNVYLKNTGILNIIKYAVPLSKISPFYDGYNCYKKEETSIRIPDEYINYIGADSPNFSLYYSENYIYLYKKTGSQIAAKAEFKILKINKETLQAEVVTLTNPFSHYIYFDLGTNATTGENSSQYARNFAFTDDYWFFSSYETENGINKYCITRTKLTDSTNVIHVESFDDDGSNGTSFSIKSHASVSAQHYFPTLL